MTGPSGETRQAPSPAPNPYLEIIEWLDLWGFRHAEKFVRSHFRYACVIEEILMYLDAYPEHAAQLENPAEYVQRMTEYLLNLDIGADHE